MSSASLIIDNIGDPSLHAVVDRVAIGDAATFENIESRFPFYDREFLWLLAYPHEGAESKRNYIASAYKKYHQVLDPDFLRLLASKGNFTSRMWELALSDILSTSGELVPKSPEGADFRLKLPNGQTVYVEAVAPEESDNPELRSVRPDFSKGKFFTYGGEIHELELPIVLRALQAFNRKKSAKSCDGPYVIAINSHKATGISTNDAYVLRRLLFGLGNLTLTRLSDDSFRRSFEQLPTYAKPGRAPFKVGFFRDQSFSRISGVIYSSQNPLGLVPDSNQYGWHNAGVTFVPNAFAKNPVHASFPFFRCILCTDQMYQELDAAEPFVSSVNCQ